jgi:hypothetical protein
MKAYLTAEIRSSHAQDGPNYPVYAQERPMVSRHGVGHDTWHAIFYAQLLRDDGTPCCSLNDCRPTLSRMINNHYEVLVDGDWTAVPANTIKRVIAPDHGAHVCAPQRKHDWDAGVIYCVVLPPEG